MTESIAKYLEYLRSVKNSSPHTVSNYGKDLDQFVTYLSPPGARPPALSGVTHRLIREFIAHLHDQGLEKSSIARKLAALRSFFKYCVREGRLKESPARLVPTPKLPKRIPSVLSAEEMNGFLNQLARMAQPAQDRLSSAKGGPSHASSSPGRPRNSSNPSVRSEEGLFLRRDRALLELLYAAGLRVSELTGLNLADIEQRERILRVRGKGIKERIVPSGASSKNTFASSTSTGTCTRTRCVMLSRRISSPMAPIFAPFKNSSATNPSPPPRSTPTLPFGSSWKFTTGRTPTLRFCARSRENFLSSQCNA